MIKSNLEEAFPGIWVEGEISGYLHHSSGHHYLNLKDDKAVLRVTIWRSVGHHLKFEPENGQKVLVYGDIAVYEKGGSYQLNCRKMTPIGIGPLELAFRQLYDKLEAEGLFDESEKQELPLFPRKIGVVTSPTGAAIRDILQIARRRNSSIEVVIFPAAVQGDGAEETIAAGIEYFNSRDDIELIITGRGGGSLEDLWPFNTEVTVRAIAASRIPIISAVGHEIDITLSDHVADLRVPTPSAAAEIAFWSMSEFEERTRGAVYTQTMLIREQVRQARQTLRSLLARPVLARPLDLVYQKRQQLDSLSRLLVISGKNGFDRCKNRLSLVLSRLDTLSPLNILKRGYSVSRRFDNQRLVHSGREIAVGERMETIVEKGKIVSRVEEISKRK
jgi:exodeoxyribonuclease VII large subunit